MTTTPDEPVQDPRLMPSGDPEPGNAPQTEPDTLPDEDDAATGSDR